MWHAHCSTCVHEPVLIFLPSLPETKSTQDIQNGSEEEIQSECEDEMTALIHTLRNPALIVIDVQKGFDNQDFFGKRNNYACEENIAELVQQWSENDWPIVLVQHDSLNRESPLHPANPGHDFKDFITVSGSLQVNKTVNSCFYGTPNLDDWLRAEGISEVVLCGITTNHCCETTARMAGNLGYQTLFVLDATHTFDRKSLDGSLITADEIARVTASNLEGEFARVVSTAELLRD